MIINPKNPDFWTVTTSLFPRSWFYAAICSPVHFQIPFRFHGWYQEFKTKRLFHPDHPENFQTNGLKVTNGTLRQGICNTVGLFMAEANKGDVWAWRILKLLTTVLTFSWVMSAAWMVFQVRLAFWLIWSWKDHFLLWQETYLYRRKHEDIFHWRYWRSFLMPWMEVVNVRNRKTDISALEKPIAYTKDTTDKPTSFKVSVIIGYGSPNKSKSHYSHIAALGAGYSPELKCKVITGSSNFKKFCHLWLSWLLINTNLKNKNTF